MKKIFNIFRKSKKIEFQCLVDKIDPNILYPPIESHKLPLPNWYKERAKSYKKTIDDVIKCPFKSHPSQSGNVIKCPGIKDLINSGFTIRMWADFFIDLPKGHPSTTKGLNYGFGRGLENFPELREHCAISAHHHSQFPQIFDKARTYPLILKFNFPWKVKAPKGVAFYMLPAYYGDESDYAMTPGVYDPVYVNQIIINLQIFLQEGRLIIPAGTPMCKLIPFYRKERFDLCVTPFDPNDTTRLSERFHLLKHFQNDYDSLVKEREKMFNIFTD